MEMEILDMSKLKSPFVRDPSTHLVTPVVDEESDWVFEDDDVICTEKLDGTNVSVVIDEQGNVTRVYNRKNRIPFISNGGRKIIDAINNSNKRGYVNLSEGQHFGECVGPGIQGNPYKLDKHLWIPFNTYARKNLRYKTWGKYPKTFEALSEWFKDDIFSLFASKFSSKRMFPEGVVFVQPSTGKMAKLRRDMFDWYEGARHKEC